MGEDLATLLERKVRAELGSDAFPNPEGWQLKGVEMHEMRGGDATTPGEQSPVLCFKKSDRQLIVALLAQDLSQPAFRRTAHYDITYHSPEDPDRARSDYEHNRDMLERFAAWVGQWDKPDAPSEDAGEPREASGVGAEPREVLAARLEKKVRAELGTYTFPNPEGWRLKSVELQALRGDRLAPDEQSPVLCFERADQQLLVAVVAQDPSQPAFHRTAHYDVVYISRGDPDEVQRDYERNRGMLERFAAWVDRWDKPDASSEDAGEPREAPGVESEPREVLAARLEKKVREELDTDAFPNPEGWRLKSVELQALRGDRLAPDEQSPVLCFEQPDRQLLVALVTQDPSQPAFRRTAHYDIAYISRGDPDEVQRDYERNRDMLERFADWVERWDKPDASSEAPDPAPGSSGAPGEPSTV